MSLQGVGRRETPWTQSWLPTSLSAEVAAPPCVGLPFDSYYCGAGAFSRAPGAPDVERDEEADCEKRAQEGGGD